jgi:UDP-2,4-diacetamido-2,4,6-trideoxy-beta-L-altropyranose hydrolase
VIVIRADAGPESGLGHVMRCLALAERYAADGGGVTFAAHGVPEDVAARMAANGIELVPAPSDAAGLAQLARERRAAWVVLDGYAFGPGYESRVVASGIPVLVVDDDGLLGGEGAALVLNQGPGAHAGLYPGRAPDTLLLGPPFRLLRPEFALARAPLAEAPETGLRVLVSMGGADVAGLSATAVRALDLAGPAVGEAVVVVGPHANGAEAVRAAARASTVPVQVLQAPADMAEVMAASDLSVVAAGGSASELCFLGVPTVLVSTAPNQVDIAAALARHGVGVDAGWHADVDEARLGEALASLADDVERRTQMAARGRALVDGRGADRVLARLVAEGPAGG